MPQATSLKQPGSPVYESIPDRPPRTLRTDLPPRTIVTVVAAYVKLQAVY